MPKKEPALDLSLPYADIYGSSGSGLKEPRYAQNGHYFAADRSYLSSDANAPTLYEEPTNVEVQVSVESAVTDPEEIALYLADERADEMLKMPREDIVEAVSKLNGPVVQGDDSQKMMVAWLIKHAT